MTSPGGLRLEEAPSTPCRSEAAASLGPSIRRAVRAEAPARLRAVRVADMAPRWTAQLLGRYLAGTSPVTVQFMPSAPQAPV